MKPKPKTPPVLVIHDAARMTDYDRRSVAEWMRLQARNLIKHGARYPKVFTVIYQKE